MKLNLWQWLWSHVWNLSEWGGVGLGRFAPWVFHQMIGCDKPCKRIDGGGDL